MSDAAEPLDLDALSGEHVRRECDVYGADECAGHCAADGHDWPCDTDRLLAEVERLRAALTEARATKDMWKERYEQQTTAVCTARRDALVEAADWIDDESFEVHGATRDFHQGMQSSVRRLRARAAQEGDPR